MPDADDQRAVQLAASLAAVRGRIADACAAAGRSASEVTLVAVTKTYPASDVAALARLGMHDVGESKAQEAQAKRAELDELPNEDVPVDDLRWHVLGQIQSNKARAIGSFAHAVHSLDRAKLVDRLADGAAGRAQPVEVYLQVSLDGDPERGGAAPEQLDDLADAVAGRDELRLRGLMAVPPIGTDPSRGFTTLQELGARLRQRHPAADGLSAGMSDDLEAAIAHGSTLVRVGTALLGRREPLFH